MKIPPAQIESYIKKIADEKIMGCVVFGPDVSLVKYRFDLIAKQIVNDISDPFLVANLSKERISEDQALLSDEFFSMSMLGGRRLILVRDSDAKTAEAVKLLMREKHVSGDSENFILIQGGDLDKSSALRKIAETSSEFAAIACYEENEFSAKKFIEETLRSKHINFDSNVADAILARIGANRQAVLNEVEKIDLYLGDNRVLNSEIVAQLIGVQSEAAIQEFVSSFASQNIKKAIVQSRRLLTDGVEPVMLLRFLGNYLQKLYLAKQQLAMGEGNLESVVKAQRLFFKVEAEFRKHLQNTSLEFLQKALVNVEKAEVDIKSGKAGKLAVASLMVNG